MKIVLSLKQVK